jgi:hypothetical protein
MKTLAKLKPRNKILEDFYVFDVETTPFKEDETVQFKFGVVYSFGYCKVITTIDEFKKEFEQERYRNRKVFAHNAEFDLNVIYGNIFYVDKAAVFNNKFISATNGNAIFCDSMNIYRTSVKEIGKMLNLEKKDNSALLESEDLSYTKEDIEYCVRDCEIVYEALLIIFNKVGSIRITAPSLSLEYYRRYFQPYHIDYVNESEYFFKSYYGGRCEALKLGKTNAIVVDINSMYPYAMKYCEFPNPKRLRVKRNVTNELFINKYLEYYEGCAIVTVTHYSSFIGGLPYRKDEKLIFPLGIFQGWYNFNELRYCLNNSLISIMEVKEIVFAERMESPFISFIDENYTARKAANGIEKENYKLFMNSLYGKFAQQIKSAFIYIHDILDKESNELIEKYETEGTLIKLKPFNKIRNDIFIEVKSTIGSHLYNTIPVFSSYITSFARIMLLDNLLKYQDYKPIYCDTDSIFFEIEPPINYSDELGAWKLEDKVVTEIRGLKNYSYISKEKEIDKIKGIPKRAEKIFNKYYFYSLTKTKESLVREKSANTYLERNKKIKGEYTKRIVHEDGTTEPIVL